MPDAPLALVLLRAGRWFDRQLLERLEVLGWPRLSPAQSLAIAHIPGEGTSPSALARELGASRQATHQLVAGLARLGIVTVRPDPARVRGRLITFTDTGLQMVGDALHILAALEQRLPPGDVRTLHFLLGDFTGLRPDRAEGEQAVALIPQQSPPRSGSGPAQKDARLPGLPAAPDFYEVFRATPVPSCLVNRDLAVVAVNTAYEELMERLEGQVVGADVCDVTVGAPLEAAGRRALRTSVLTALGLGETDVLPLQTLSVRSGEDRRGERVWSVANVPVSDASGTVRWILHRTEDVTEVLRGADQVPFTDMADHAPSRQPRGSAATRELQLQLGAAVRRSQALLLQRNRARLVASVAETLQKSLLTEPPEPDHLHVVVRYRPALAHASVGGDWFDVFLDQSGHTTLVIGDVVGHDQDAIAQMASLRNVLRGIAYSTDGGPATLVGTLDRTMHGLGTEAMATMLLARIEQDRQAASAGQRTLRWSNAGHLPPVLVHPDGQVSLLTNGTDLMLGVDPDSTREDHVAVLPEGATVLLYTDGLVERPGESLTAGLDRLVATLAAHTTLTLDELCDTVLDTLTGDGRDDVALAAVRFFPETAPRPAEAGPTRLPGGDTTRPSDPRP